MGRLRQLSTLVAEKLSAVLPPDPNGYATPVSYFQTFAEVAARLEILATEELTGAARTQADLDFFNDAVATKTRSAG